MFVYQVALCLLLFLAPRTDVFDDQRVIKTGFGCKFSENFFVAGLELEESEIDAEIVLDSYFDEELDEDIEEKELKAAETSSGFAAATTLGDKSKFFQGKYDLFVRFCTS